jgi:hypothetical protein
MGEKNLSTEKIGKTKRKNKNGKAKKEQKEKT